MKKLVISKLFLYRHRFLIGYSILGVIFFALVSFMPLLSPNGLSDAEINSATISANLSFDSVKNGDLVDLPYHLIQKLFITIFGLSIYAIKLPSIFIGAILGLLLVLLLNRWFKNNVALLASILTVLSTPFLYLVGSGTPLIMLVFWPTFLLWLGSKIQGIKKPKPFYCFIFAIALLLSVFTPYLIYFAAFCIIFVLVQPHLRFTIKTLPKLPLILTSLIVLAGLTVFGINLFHHTNAFTEILFMPDFSFASFFANINQGLITTFSSNNVQGSTFLSPLIGIAVLAIALVGLFSTTKGFLASRNSIATCLIIFTLILTGFNASSIILIILPLAILTAHGLRYTLEKWYNLFPENPYARIFGLFPLTILLSVIIYSDLAHFTYGYRYNANIANEFNNDLSLVLNLSDSANLILIPDNPNQFNFYKILEQSSDFTVVDTLPKNFSGNFLTLGKPNLTFGEDVTISRIITSPKSDNSDRIYLYSKQ